MEQKSIVLKEIWVPAESAFRFREAQDPTSGERRFLMNGLMLPFGKVSRNNVLYEKQSIHDKHKQLIGRPVMYNHQIEGQALPVGHFTNSYCVESADETHPVAGWYYEADIDPEEKDMIRKVKRGDLRHVSIQLVGGRVFEKVDQTSGKMYSEAHVADIIEGSIVPAPGFLDTTAKFAEMFAGLKEQAGAVIPHTPMDSDGMNPAGERPAVSTENTTGGTTTMAESTNTQAPAASSADKDKGASATPDSVGQDKTAQPALQLKEQNDATKDTQAGASIPPDTTAGYAKGTPDSVGQDETTADRSKDTARLEKAKRKEAAEDDSAEEGEELEEHFKEFVEAYEDDMSKMAEIMERLKEQVDGLKQEITGLKNAGAPVTDAGSHEEPKPPMSESTKLRNVFTETVSPQDDKTRFSKALGDVLRG